jgi:hypothetical protein
LQCACVVLFMPWCAPAPTDGLIFFGRGRGIDAGSGSGSRISLGAGIGFTSGRGIPFLPGVDSKASGEGVTGGTSGGKAPAINYDQNRAS